MTVQHAIKLAIPLLLASLAAGAASAAEHPLTLSQTINLALDKNEQIQIARESLAAARAGVNGAQGAFDPVVEISGGWSRTSQPLNSSFLSLPQGVVAPTVRSADGAMSVKQLLPTGGSISLGGSAARQTTTGPTALLAPAYGTQVGIEVRQPLLRGLAVDPARRSVRQARSLQKEASADLRRTVTEVVTEVEEAYWSLVSARLSLNVLDESVRLAEKQLNETNKRVESGSAPETELAQPRAELQRRTGDLLAAREELSRAENRLKLLVLDDDDALWPEQLVPVDETSTEITPLNVAALMDEALKNRPEVASREAAVNLRRAETAFANDGVRPAVDAVLSYDRYGLAGTRNPALAQASLPPGMDGDFSRSFRLLRDGDFDAARLALVVELPIRNRSAAAAAASARSAQREAEADLTRARKEIRAEVLDAAAALETAGQRIAAARAGREAAEVQLQTEQDRYGVGLSTNFLVLTRQNDLSRARLDEISALTDYRKARAEMARATGAVIGEKGMDKAAIEDVRTDQKESPNTTREVSRP